MRQRIPTAGGRDTEIVHETTANVRPSRAAGEEWVPITSSLRSNMTAADQPMVQPSFPAETR
jgi:hypothetical protein